MGMNFNFIKKTPDIIHELKLDLKQIYTGVTKTLRIQRKIVCINCSGYGGTNIFKCTNCNGVGKIMKTEINGLFRFSQEVQCNNCTGSGKSYNKTDTCTSCNGNRFKIIIEELIVNVPPSAPNGNTVIFPKKAHEDIGYETGNFIVIVQSIPLSVDNQNKYGNYQRKTSSSFDLQVEIQIDLITALIGGKISWLHLDDEYITLTLPKGKVISHGQILTLNDYGLQKTHENNKYGTLDVIFSIKMPSNKWAQSINGELVKSILSPTTNQ
jgi:DnaJ family protein A protein 2